MLRSIPAWAGEPTLHRRVRRLPAVYPRVGGGTELSEKLERDINGLSPRGRGNLLHQGIIEGSGGSIPAWAGEPVGLGLVKILFWVYPRRGRGNRDSAGHQSMNRGSIPAWAGEPGAYIGMSEGDAVYPRVGGGTYKGGRHQTLIGGLSPRGRGNRGSCYGRSALHGSIPAWAGEPLRYYWERKIWPVYPRVGGGTVRDHTRTSRPSRSIPAWAGGTPLPSSVT